MVAVWACCPSKRGRVNQPAEYPRSLSMLVKWYSVRWLIRWSHKRVLGADSRSQGKKWRRNGAQKLRCFPPSKNQVGPMRSQVGTSSSARALSLILPRGRWTMWALRPRAPGLSTGVTYYEVLLMQANEYRMHRTKELGSSVSVLVRYRGGCLGRQTAEQNTDVRVQLGTSAV